MVMEFPDTVVTNVYEITGVHEIYWNLFHLFRKDDIAIAFTVGDEETVEAARSYGLETEQRMRRQGKHVLLDIEANILWIFCLSKAEAENLPTLMKPINFDGEQDRSRLMIGLPSKGATKQDIATLSGNIRIADIVPANPMKSDPKASDEQADPNATAFQVNRTIVPNVAGREVRPAEGMLNKMELYRKIMRAISLSLAQSLTELDDWMQYHGPLCINVSSLGDHYLESTVPKSYLLKTKIGYFNVQWRCTGCLIISANTQNITRICRVSFLMTERKTELPIGTPVTLAPFGIKGTLNGPFVSAAKRPLSDLRSEHQSAVINLLAAFEHSVSRDIPWIQILIPSDALQETDTSLLLWPANLCFCEDPLKLEFLDAVPNLPIEDSLVDPLARAEAWFLGRHERAKAIKEKKRTEDLEAQKIKDLKGNNYQDAASNIVSPVNHYINSQDVSGIYPTPPDGFPSQANESSVNNDVHDTPKGLEKDDAGSVDGAHDGLQEADNDGLFDEDMDMFASNGVTDADFSFFDEPKRDGDDQVATKGETPTLAIESKDEHADSDLHAGGSDEVQPVEEAFDEAIESIREPLVNASVSPSLKDASIENDSPPISAVTESQTAGSQANEIVSRESSFSSEESNFDRKYTTNGRFGFHAEDLPLSSSLREQAPSGAALPIIGFHDDDSSSTSEKQDIAEDDQLSTCSQRFRKLDRSPPQTPKSSKRKREDVDGTEYPATPMSRPSQPDETIDLLERHLMRPTAALFDAISEPDTLTPEPEYLDNSGVAYVSTERSFIQVAQLVADQIISSTRLLRISSTNSYTGLELERPSSDWKEYHADTMPHGVAGVFPSQQQCTLDSYANLDRGADRPFESFNLFTPHTTIQRMGKPMDMLASALPFWEELSLNPFSGSKHICTCSIFPDRTYLRSAIFNFMEMMRGAYQPCNLGVHNVGISEDLASDGLVVVKTSAQHLGEYLRDLNDFCESFGTELAKHIRGENTVVYLFDPFNTEDSLPGLCAAFLKLFEAYRSALTTANSTNDLVLQVVPLDFVFSPDRLVFPSLRDYRQLALEVYDRCSPKEAGDQGCLPYIGAPAVRLAKIIPRKIDFRLSADSSSAPLYHDRCIHVAYSWTPGEIWLTASWTDNQGVLQWNAPYWLGIDDVNPTQPFYLAAKEMWEVTKMMLNPLNSSWRVFIVKDEPLTLEEMEVWQSIIADNEKRTNISFTILSVDSEPFLAFPPQPSTLRKVEDGPVLPVTPESTPLASGASPEVPISTPGGAAQAPTPGPTTTTTSFEQDPDARLIDRFDETWGLVLDRSIDDPYISSPYAKALASGYLLKRAGTRDGDVLLPVAVSILFGKEPYGELLKEVLGIYRGLATLARARGVIDTDRGVLPIHVASAGKAKDVIRRTIRFDGD